MPSLVACTIDASGVFSAASKNRKGKKNQTRPRKEIASAKSSYPALVYSAALHALSEFRYHRKPGRKSSKAESSSLPSCRPRCDSRVCCCYLYLCCCSAAAAAAAHMLRLVESAIWGIERWRRGEGRTGIEPRGPGGGGKSQHPTPQDPPLERPRFFQNYHCIL
jgi:hypothetical protein